MHIVEAQKYAELLRKEGEYAVAMWHWGENGYCVVVSSRQAVVSSHIQMARFLREHKIQIEREGDARSHVKATDQLVSSAEDGTRYDRDEEWLTGINSGNGPLAPEP